MKSTYCSINWGKSAALAMMMLVLALMVISLGMLNHNVAPNGIGVDWGSRCPAEDPKCKRQGVDWGSSPMPLCPPGQKDCKVAVDWGNSMAPCLPTDPKCLAGEVAVDWGSFTAPCLPTDPNCGLGPVAVDWGDSYSPDYAVEPPFQVAVDWGNRAPKP